MRGRLPPAEACALLAPVAEQLATWHAAGHTHGGVQPATVLPFEVPPLAGPLPTAASTAPEGPSGAAADVYSLGTVLHELVAEEPPFGTGDAAELARRHREQPPPVLPLPDPLAALLAEMLAKDPRARPPADAVAHRLRALADELDGLPALRGPVPVFTPPPMRQPDPAASSPASSPAASPAAELSPPGELPPPAEPERLLRPLLALAGAAPVKVVIPALALAAAVATVLLWQRGTGAPLVRDLTSAQGEASPSPSPMTVPPFPTASPTARRTPSPPAPTTVAAVRTTATQVPVVNPAGSRPPAVRPSARPSPRPTPSPSARPVQPGPIPPPATKVESGRTCGPIQSRPLSVQGQHVVIETVACIARHKEGGVVASTFVREQPGDQHIAYSSMLLWAQVREGGRVHEQVCDVSAGFQTSASDAYWGRCSLLVDATPKGADGEGFVRWSTPDGGTGQTDPDGTATSPALA
jgi:hypothetical protein